MSDKTIELNRRRVLGGMITIGGAAAAAGAGTFAYFSDSETSSGNTIEAGTLDLGSVSETISISNLVPGGNVPSTTFTANYSGSVNAEIDINVTNLSEPSESSEPSSNNTELSAVEFAKELEVTTARAIVGANDEDLVSSGALTDADGDSTITLNDVVQESPFDAVTGSQASDGQSVGFELDLAFPSGVGNAAQADGVQFDVTLIAEQPSKDP